MRTVRVFIIGAAMLACAVIAIGQTSEPTPLALPPQPTPVAADAAREAELAEDIKELQELKAQNQEILKEQRAALDTLEQLEKDADQIKIFSKRG